MLKDYLRIAIWTIVSLALVVTTDFTFQYFEVKDKLTNTVVNYNKLVADNNAYQKEIENCYERSNTQIKNLQEELIKLNRRFNSFLHYECLHHPNINCKVE